MNMEYVKGPTKVINNLANGFWQISKPYNVCHKVSKFHYFID